MKEIFQQSYETMGVFNKNGEKIGIKNTKIPPRILQLAVDLVIKMGVTAYNKFKDSSAPFLPSYSTIQNYIRKVSKDTGYHEDLLFMAEMYSNSEMFPKNAKKCMALSFDECIIIGYVLNKL